MVRLKEEPDEIVRMVVYGFQFQYGAIKSDTMQRFLKQEKNFNSSMVRLKAVWQGLG